MIWYPVVENAVKLGGLASLGLILARTRSAGIWMPMLLAVLIGYAFSIRVIHPGFLLDTLIHDVPWGRAALLGAFCAVGASGMVRVRSWLGVVVGTALVGDMAIAAGLALAEPDPSRRARLIIAASGASLLSPWSGASVLALGHGGLELAGLGLLLAMVGFAGGGALRPEVVKPNLPEAAYVASVCLWLALLAWILALAGVPDFAAGGLESLPPQLPGHATMWTGMFALIVGALGYEPGLSLVASDVMDHATQLRGTWAPDAMRLGFSVGAGLPMLFLAKCKMSVGFPLWVAQALLVLAFLWFRYPI